MKLVHHEKLPGIHEDYVVTLEYRDWLFRKKVVKYRGSCTVWNRVPDGKSGSTFLQSWLCGLWQTFQWVEESSP